MPNAISGQSEIFGNGDFNHQIPGMERSHPLKVSGFIIKIDGDRAVFPCGFGCVSHVSPSVEMLLVRMGHREGNVLKDQAYCERIGALPLNPLERGIES